MINKESILEEVKSFIIEKRWDYNFELTPKTSLQNDLRIFGDDAKYIINDFCKKFKVTISTNFYFDDFFRAEPAWNDFFLKEKNYKKFLIEDLVNARITGKLNPAQ